MTKAEYRKRYRELVRDVSKSLIQYGEAALKSGAIDLPIEDSDWGLPKDVLTAALKRQVAEYAPHNPRGKHARNVKNILICTPL
jgi:hypothetical protein